MSWIKVRENLRRDPAVVHIASRLGVTSRHVVGALVDVWSWAGALTADGELPMATVELLDEVAGSSGFAAAMVEAGWLVVTPQGLVFPHWDRHNSDQAKERAMSAERQRKVRQSRKSVTDVTEVRDAERDQRRGEEKREEKKRPLPADAGSPPPPAAPAPARPRSKKPLWAGTIPDALQTPAFRDAWARWLAYRKEILKPVTQISGDQALAELTTMGEARARAAIAYTIGRGWTGLREEERASGGHPGRPGPSLAPARGQEVWRADDGCPACGHANQPQATTCASCHRPLRRASPPHSLNGTH